MKFLVRVLKSPIWDVRLAQFADAFNRRREEINLLLSLYSASGISQANETLERIETVLSRLSKAISPEESQLLNIIHQKGSIEVCENDDQCLSELVGIER